MDWTSFPEEKTLRSYSLYQCPSKLSPHKDSIEIFQDCATSCLWVSAAFPSIPWKGIYCRGITSNRSQANRRIKLTQSCQACVAGEIVRFAEGSAFKCKPRTMCRKLIFGGYNVYNLQKQHLKYGWTTRWLWGIFKHVFFLLPFIFLIYATITLNETLYWPFTLTAEIPQLLSICPCISVETSGTSWTICSLDSRWSKLPISGELHWTVRDWKYKEELQFQQLFSLSVSSTQKEIAKPYAALQVYLE